MGGLWGGLPNTPEKRSFALLSAFHVDEFGLVEGFAQRVKSSLQSDTKTEKVDSLDELGD